MGTAIWAAVFVAAVVLAAFAARPFMLRRPRTRNPRTAEPDAGERAPMALEQKRAWWSLSITLSFCAVTIVLIIVDGPDVFLASHLRLPILGLLAGVAVAYTAMLGLTALARRKEHLVADERDRTISVRAFALTWIAIVATVGVWATVLTEVYWDEGAVPVPFLSLIFLSTVMVGVLCRDIATLLGYANWSSDAEG